MMDPGSLGGAFDLAIGYVVLGEVLLGELDQQRSVKSQELVPTGIRRVHSFCYIE